MGKSLKAAILCFALLPSCASAQMLVGVLDPFVKPHSGTPTFSPGAGSYGSTQSVTISATGGSVICYNTTGSPATNGTTGCTTGTLYSGAVSVSTSETLYAVSGGTGYTDSAVGSATYTISGGSASYVSQSTNACSGYNSGTLTCAVGGTGWQTASDVVVAYATMGNVSGCGSTTMSVASPKTTWSGSSLTTPTQNNTSSQLFRGVVNSTGADTVSLTFPAIPGCVVTVTIAEFVPCATGAVDKTQSNSANAVGGNSGTTATTSHSCEILIGGVYTTIYPASGISVTSPFAAIGSGVSDLNFLSASMSYEIVSSTGAYQAAWIWTGNQNYTAGIMTLY
jgi:hypothetical protein